MQPTPQDNQLMSKHRVLSLKPQLRLEWRGQHGLDETQEPDHSASLGDSITASTRIRFSVHTRLGVVCSEGARPASWWKGSSGAAQAAVLRQVTAHLAMPALASEFLRSDDRAKRRPNGRIPADFRRITPTSADQARDPASAARRQKGRGRAGRPPSRVKRPDEEMRGVAASSSMKSGQNGPAFS